MTTQHTQHTQTYFVSGMSCSHCEDAIRNEVGEVAGVTGVAATAQDGRLVVEATAVVSDADIISAVAEAGYEATRTP